MSEQISVPSGGGAISGIGETFQPDLHTGTAQVSVPLSLPPGRSGLAPALTLAYSSASGNGPFGLGWSLSLPTVTRRTDRRVPVYDNDIDSFVLSGAEELVPVPLGDVVSVAGSTVTRYRPRTESAFARILHVTGGGQDYWEVWAGDGLVSRYGTPRPAEANASWSDPAVICRPEDGAVFSWLLTTTFDSFGNHIGYGYRAGDAAQRYLDTVRYGDYGDPASPSYAVTVALDYEQRPDPFSTRRSGFELRTALRATAISVSTLGSGGLPVTRWDLAYAPGRQDGLSLLATVTTTGVDATVSPATTQALPPLTFAYRPFAPQSRAYMTLPRSLPQVALGTDGTELVDLFADGLQSVVQLAGGTSLYWRNLGGGRFDLPRTLDNAPAGASLGSPGTLLADLDGDGRPELAVSGNGRTGAWPLAGYGAAQAGFEPLPMAVTTTPSGGLSGPQTRLLDVDGDHVSDLLLAGTPALLAAGTGTGGFGQLQRVLVGDGTPLADLADPRAMTADMTGDGLTDLVMVHDGFVEYWPNLGHGRFGAPVQMRSAPRFDDAVLQQGAGFDPRRLLLGDVTGDGTADVLYVADGRITLWLNESGNAFADPVVVHGTPWVSDRSAVRLTDLLGTGVSGVLWSGIGRTNDWAYLDLVGGAKPYLMTDVDNHRGARTTLTWSTSTAFAAAARTAGRPWSTALPFPVHVLAHSATTDTFAGTVVSSTYTYHDGYWDPVDREFRGFGRVEHTDAVSREQDTPPAAGVVQLLDPLTPRSQVPATFDPAIHGNLLANWSFDASGSSPTTLVSSTPDLAMAASIAPGWMARNAAQGTTTLDLRPSTLPQGNGGSMLHVRTSAAGCGVAQPIAAPVGDPSAVIGSVWVYVVSGRVALSTGDSQPDVACSTVGQWVLLEAGNQSPFATMLCVQATSSGGAEFYLDHAWLRVCDVPSSPMDSPPVRTVTWFSLGPVGPTQGRWREVDPVADYWSEDPPLLPAIDLTALPDPLERPVLREALRGLRGRVLRTELYADDGDPDYADRPYEVHDSVFAIAPVLDGRSPEDSDWRQHPVLTGHEVLTRSCAWDRGHDPLWTMTASAGFDDYGRPHASVHLAVPRGRGLRHSGGDACLATVTTHDHATRDDASAYRTDRVITSCRREVTDSGTGTVLELVADALAGRANGEVRALELTYYDGPAFEGLALGALGDHGVVSRTEHLVVTPQQLVAAAAPAVAGEVAAVLPPYLTIDGSAAPTTPWPGYPAAFQDEVLGAPGQRGAWLGYTWHDEAAPYVAGYYATPTRTSYDVQAPTDGVPSRGLPLIQRDVYAGDTHVRWDDHQLLPTETMDPVGLRTQAEYDYRVLKPSRVTDPNGNVTAVGYTPLGMPAWIAALGKPDAREGDTVDQPGRIFSYDFTPVDADSCPPVGVTTVARVDHRWTLVNNEDERRRIAGAAPLSQAEIVSMFGPTEAIEHPERFVRTTQFSDGSGRLLQTRTHSDPLIVSDVGLPWDLTPASSTVTADPDAQDTRVVVNGWTVFDNKGRPVVTYEPFHDVGFGYQQPTAERLSRLASTVRHYDPRGRLLVVVAPEGGQTRTTFGRPGQVALPSSAAPSPWETWTYDAIDNAGRTHPTLSLDILEQWNTPSSVEVDALGRTVTGVERGLSQDVVTAHSYDIDGHVLSVTDPLGRTAAANSYDCAGKAWRAWMLDAGTARAVFDAAGAVVERREGEQSLSLATFDVGHRATRTWASDRAEQAVTLRHVTVYGDDADLSGMTDAQARAANACGKQVAAYDEAGVVTTQSYDLDGNVGSTTRQVLRPDLLVAALPSSPDRSWSATAYAVDWQPAPMETLASRASKLLDATAFRTGLTWDGLQRTRTLTTSTDGAAGPAQIGYTYGSGGNLTGMTLDGTPYVREVAYDALGRRSLTHLGNGVVLRYLYDARSARLRRMQAQHATRSAAGWVADGPVLQDTSHRYDLAGNLLTAGERAPGCGLPTGADPTRSTGPDDLDRVFSYDALHRLVAATGRETDLPPVRPWLDSPRSVDLTRARGYVETFSYDLAGNLLSLGHAAGVAGADYSRSFTLAAGSNQLASVTSGGTTVPYGYDTAGNVVSEATNRLYEWDHANRLATFRDQAGTQPSTYAQYRYDASGARVMKVVRKSSGPDEVTVYVGPFERVLVGPISGKAVAYDRIELTDGPGQLATVLLGEALPGDGLAGSPVRYQLRDHLGSSVATLDDAGIVLNREEYLPYGETAYGSYARKRYRFTAKERDEESGLSYHHARYYAPWLGRWTSADPTGHGDGLNLYAYCGGNPTMLHDPDGRAGVLPGQSVARSELGPLWNKAMTNVLGGETVKEAEALYHGMLNKAWAAKGWGSNRTRGTVVYVARRKYAAVRSELTALTKAAGLKLPKGMQLHHRYPGLSRNPFGAMNANRLRIATGNAGTEGTWHNLFHALEDRLPAKVKNLLTAQADALRRSGNRGFTTLGATSALLKGFSVVAGLYQASKVVGDARHGNYVDAISHGVEGAAAGAQVAQWSLAAAGHGAAAAGAGTAAATLGSVSLAGAGGWMIGTAVNNHLSESTQESVGGTLDSVVNQGGWRELFVHPFGIGMAGSIR